MMNDDYNIQMPGRVIEYFPEDQTSTVVISSSRTFSNSSSDEKQVSQVLLYDVPTFTPGGGGWHMTFPIKPGDSCLIQFSQFGYDHWLYNDKDEAGTRIEGNPEPWTYRRFSIDDGFCQVGWNTIPRAVQNYHATNSEWRNAEADQVISLVDDKSIVITSPISVTINAPEVTVNSNIATVNSPSTVVNGETLQATLSTGATFTTPLVTMTGNLLVGGAIGSGGQAVPGSGMTIGGPITSTKGGTFAEDLTAAGISVANHTHPENGDGGGETGPPS